MQTKVADLGVRVPPASATRWQSKKRSPVLICPSAHSFSPVHSSTHFGCPFPADNDLFGGGGGSDPGSPAAVRDALNDAPPRSPLPGESVGTGDLRSPLNWSDVFSS